MAEEIKQQEAEAAKAPHRIAVDTGAFNPVLGLCYTEIAGISRSQHRSQGMGAPQNRGPALDYDAPHDRARLPVAKREAVPA